VIADLRVETGDDGPVTALPDAYRGTGGPSAATGARPVDDGDGVLGRYLGLLGAQVEQTSSVIDELPALLSPSVAPDRDDSRWLETLATWVALDLTRLPQSDADRRENVTSAVDRHGRRGTRDGLVDQVRRETGLLIEVSEPILDAAVWRLDGTTGASTLGLTTGLVASDPGPPVLDRTAILDGSMLVEEREAGLPVHGTVAHRICVHVADSTPEQVAAVDAVVQRERPAHVLARTCTVSRRTTVPTQVGTDMLPPCGPPGLRNDTAYGTDVDGPGNRLGAVRLPAEPIKSSDQPADAPA
jgi:phage tail-like protein